MLIIGGGALATLAIGTVVALGIVQQGKGDGEGTGGQADDSLSASGGTTDPPSQEPTFEPTTVPPLPKPREFITDADKDIAPFTADGFFAGETMTIDDREYTRQAVHEATDCAEGGTEKMGAALAEHGCVALLRATYSGGAVTVTVGVAQFPTEEEAAAAKEASKGAHITPLISGDAPEFCGRGGCRTTRNQVGRYAYFTIAGNSDNTPDSGEDTAALQAARDGNEHAHARIVLRGENQASASASARVDERQNGGG
jgi:hypothetical protein